MEIEDGSRRIFLCLGSFLAPIPKKVSKNFPTVISLEIEAYSIINIKVSNK